MTPNEPRRGAFITVEGIEGVGKSTCLDAMGAHLARAGIEFVTTREPGGTALGERIREWILHGSHEGLAVEVEALLMFAARAAHLDEVIRPALAAGRWVVCDRFTDATFAYQGGGRGASRAFLDCLTAGVQGPLEPDLTLLLDASVETALGRIAGRKHDHFEREAHEFFERVRAAYLALHEANPHRIRCIDAAQPVEEVQADIESELDRFTQRFAEGAA